MIVEIVGIFEHNKGALLMLEAIRERITQSFPEARFAVPTSMSETYRRSQNLLGVIDHRAGLRTRLKGRLPGPLLRKLGLIRQSDVDVFLDASGFGYGDFWGLPKLESRLLGTLRKWKTKNNVAVLLPQALGPFEKPGMADTFKKGVDLLDLVFVRDSVSLDYVHRTGCDPSKIRTSPDYTNLLHPPLPAHLQRLAGRSFVIPNEKMVSGERSDSREAYVRFLAASVSEIAASGRQVDLLIHEGPKDRALAEEARAKLGGTVAIEDASSPLDTKAVIANADLIVSSRFHGLVSGLSNAVPSLACGWSHKYAELLMDYGVPELAADLNNESEWVPKIRTLLSIADSADGRDRLREAAKKQQELSSAMWVETISTIETRFGRT